MQTALTKSCASRQNASGHSGVEKRRGRHEHEVAVRRLSLVNDPDQKLTNAILTKGDKKSSRKYLIIYRTMPRQKMRCQKGFVGNELERRLLAWRTVPPRQILVSFGFLS